MTERQTSDGRIWITQDIFGPLLGVRIKISTGERLTRQERDQCCAQSVLVLTLEEAEEVAEAIFAMLTEAEEAKGSKP